MNRLLKINDDGSWIPRQSKFVEFNAYGFQNLEVGWFKFIFEKTVDHGYVCRISIHINGKKLEKVLRAAIESAIYVDLFLLAHELEVASARKDDNIVIWVVVQ